MLEVEPPGPPDRSELGLLGSVLGAGSEHWSCGPAVGSEVHVNPAHLAVTHFHKAQAGAVVRPRPAAPDAGSDPVGDGPGRRLGETPALRIPVSAQSPSAETPGKGVARVSGSTLTQPFSVRPAFTTTSDTLCTGMPMNRSNGSSWSLKCATLPAGSMP